MSPTIKAYNALILAGGEGSRMGGADKGLQGWQGHPLFEHALACLQGQSVPPHAILISANRNQAIYAASACLVVVDQRDGFAGPLAGVEAGLYASALDWLLCIPCDMPMLPKDLAARLIAAIHDGAPAAYAETDDGAQPVCCMVQRKQLNSLSEALDQGNRRVISWLASIGALSVNFGATNAFMNCNTLAELNESLHGNMP
jgi:molybdenum cofactor guanylyltransferase